MNIDIKHSSGATKSMDISRCSELVENMQNQPILVIGDMMLDRFCYGSVDRISPESPIPVLAVKREDSMLGGAGNALANLVGLKASAHIIAVIGDDTEGKKLIELAKEQNIDVSGVVVSERPTTVKIRFLSGHQQLLRTDYEDKTPVSEKLCAQLIQEAKAKIPQMKAVILSDYDKGLLRQDFIAEVISCARENGVPVIVDPKGTDFSIYRGATAVTPNKKELSEATKNHPVATDEDIEAAAKHIIEECGIEAVVATRSSDGISVIKENEESVHIPTQDIEVYDVSGAGDTVIATIASALAVGADLSEASVLANIAGSVVVTKVGTAPIRASELLDVLAGAGETQGLISPVLDWDSASEQVKRWHARGLKVGFTNGCFDILHAGHVTYLAEAKSYCDRLILGLNHDASVRLLKGPERPIHDETARAQVLAALSSIDLVVFFGAEKAGDDNTPSAILGALKPDIFFKGGDYTIEDLPEAKVVHSYGGEVSIMCEKEGYSTTNAINKIRGAA